MAQDVQIHKRVVVMRCLVLRPFPGPLRQKVMAAIQMQMGHLGGSGIGGIAVVVVVVVIIHIRHDLVPPSLPSVLNGRMGGIDSVGRNKDGGVEYSLIILVLVFTLLLLLVRQELMQTMHRGLGKGCNARLFPFLNVLRSNVNGLIPAGLQLQFPETLVDLRLHRRRRHKDGIPHLSKDLIVTRFVVSGPERVVLQSSMVVTLVTNRNDALVIVVLLQMAIPTFQSRRERIVGILIVALVGCQISQTLVDLFPIHQRGSTCHPVGLLLLEHVGMRRPPPIEAVHGRLQKFLQRRRSFPLVQQDSTVHLVGQQEHKRQRF
mmetsp:Transcript_6319/g.17811  ORF Transcript_6319/g.17811 Transcript_6319/m.17811 type:complete len:319 (-) Transcript_6319:715-1671(-)